MNKTVLLSFLILAFIILIASLSYFFKIKGESIGDVQKKVSNIVAPQNTNSLSIEVMRNKSYPGSNITIEQTLEDGSNYHQYIASYLSEGLKIYGLLTVPMGEKPKTGWPVIIFNHGYIDPAQYQTTQRYVAYVDYFAKNGYIVFKSDYRGNGNSQGDPLGAYYSPAYATDVLNALSSLKKYPEADPNRIGMWGHSMGGNITLRDLVVNTKDIKAAVIWGGVVGSYNDMINNWQGRVPFRPGPRELALRNSGRQSLIAKYGSPSANPTFWNTIDPTNYISDITAPVQLDVGGNDEEVPVAFSQSLYDKLKSAGKNVEIYIYPDSDHNISQGFSLAMERSLAFFNKYVKGGENS